MVKSCCVVGCTNRTNNTASWQPELSYYLIPSQATEPERRESWLLAINRCDTESKDKNKLWRPRSEFHYVCSVHFHTGRKVNDASHPDYVPSIFPEVDLKKLAKKKALSKGLKSMKVPLRDSPPRKRRKPLFKTGPTSQTEDNLLDSKDIARSMDSHPENQATIDSQPSSSWNTSKIEATRCDDKSKNSSACVKKQSLPPLHAHGSEERSNTHQMKDTMYVTESFDILPRQQPLEVKACEMDVNEDEDVTFISSSSGTTISVADMTESSGYNDGMDCMPVILSVRGNAEDFDSIDEEDHTSVSCPAGNLLQKIINKNATSEAESSSVPKIISTFSLSEALNLPLPNTDIHAKPSPVSLPMTVSSTHVTSKHWTQETEAKGKTEPKAKLYSLISGSAQNATASTIQSQADSSVLKLNSTSANTNSGFVLLEAPSKTNNHHQMASGSSVPVSQPRMMVSLLDSSKNPISTGEIVRQNCVRQPMPRSTNSIALDKNMMAPSSANITKHVIEPMSCSEKPSPSSVSPKSPSSLYDFIKTVVVGAQGAKTKTTSITNVVPISILPSGKRHNLDGTRQKPDSTNRVELGDLDSVSDLQSPSDSGRSSYDQDGHDASLSCSTFEGLNRQEVFDAGLLAVVKTTSSDADKKFICEVCGDAFHEENFLEFHRDRQVFVLSYHCTVCSKLLTFYNKCTFWQHIAKESSEDCIKKTPFMRLAPLLDVQLDATKLDKLNDISHLMSQPVVHRARKSLSRSSDKTREKGPSVLVDRQPPIQKKDTRNDRTASPQLDTSSGIDLSVTSNVSGDKRSSLQEVNARDNTHAYQWHVTSENPPQKTKSKVHLDKTPPSEVDDSHEEPLPLQVHENVSADLTSSVSSDVPSDKSSSSQSNGISEKELHAPSDLSCQAKTTVPNVSLVKVIKCPFCQYVYESTSFKAHFQQLREVRTCDICQMDFYNPCSLAAHCQIHSLEEKKNDILCPECGETLPYSSNFKSIFQHLDNCCHFNICTTISCICNLHFPSQNALKEHVLKKHLKLFYGCKTCSKGFSSVEHLDTHHRYHHPDTMVGVSVRVQCALCDRSWHQAKSLKDHVEQELKSPPFTVKRKMYQCMMCPFYFFPSAGSLNKHIEAVHTHKPKRCTLCFALFKGRQSLVNHLVSKACLKQLPKKLHLCLDAFPAKETVFRDSQYANLFQVKGLDTLPFSGADTGQLPDMSLAANSQTFTPASSQSVVFVPISAPSSYSKGDVPASQAIVSLQTSALGKRLQMSEKSPQTILSQQSSQTSALAKRLQMSEKSPQTILSQQSSPISKRPPPSEKPATPDGRKYQCHKCKICLIGRHNFDRHMSHHTSSNLSTDRTHCVVCKKMVASISIRSHMEEHQNKGIVVCSLCHRRDFASLALARSHSKNMCGYIEERGWGEAYLKEKQQAPRIIPTNDCHATSGEASDQQEKDKSNSGNLNLSKSTSNQSENAALVYPCLMCGLAFSSKRTKEDHVSRVHDGTRTIYICLVCKKRGIRKEFHKKQKASLHISRKHRIILPASISKLILEEEQNMTSGQVLPVVEVSAKENTDAPPPKRLRLAAEGAFLCGKCGFTDGQRDVFEQHIKCHNPKDEPQCPECGLCFTVMAALKKHLFAVHRIKGVDSYCQERGILEVVEEVLSEGEDVESTLPVDVIAVYDDDDECERTRRDIRSKGRSAAASKSHNLLECTVCYKTFSCESVLKTHMRNHGMAFIRSRRHKDQGRDSPSQMELSS